MEPRTLLVAALVTSLALATAPPTIAGSTDDHERSRQAWRKLPAELGPDPGVADGVQTAKRALDASTSTESVQTHGLESTVQAAGQLLDATPKPVLGEPAPAPSGSPASSPSETIRTLAERHEGPLEQMHEGELAAIEGLEPDVRRALSHLLEAFVAFEEAGGDYVQALDRPLDPPPMDEAHAQLADVEAGEEPASLLARLAADAIPVDELSSLLDARQRMLHAGLALDRALNGGHADVQLDLCPTVAIDLLGTSTSYEEDCLLVVDAGGNDTYHNNAGGSNMVERQAPCGSFSIPQDNNASALVDLGGDDAYGDPADPVDCGANGGGWAGAGFLLDVRGHDTYVAGEGAGNGGGYDGLGTLVDLAGDDEYDGEQSVNAASFIGAGALYDARGNDSYSSERIVANGAGLLGAAVVVDGTGNDRYAATESTVNGAGGLGSGVIVDGAGHDTYSGEARANGGATLGTGTLVDASGDDVYEAGAPPSNGQGELAAAVLLDGQGADRYTELPDRNTRDKTIFPKGSFGAQIDVPHGPEEIDHPVQDTPAQDQAKPHVIVGVGDDGINPYHEAFYRPELTEHPCTYVRGFPCSVQRLDLTLPADPSTSVSTVDEAFERDEDQWNRTRPGEVFWIPQTPFVAVTCQGAQGPGCAFDTDHGVETTSSVLAENPDALIGFVASDGDIEPLEAYDVPVDLYSVSFGNPVPIPLPGGPCPLADDAPIYVTSAGNDPYSTLASCWKGNPRVISVGGAYAADDTEEAQATKQPEVTSYYCRPVAFPRGTSGTFTDCGTSFATPTVAGALSKVVLQLREDTGYTGSVATDTVAPGVSVADLRDALNRTASYDPEPAYLQTSEESDYGNLTGVPLNPVAPWLQWGWGFYDGLVAEDTIDHLRDNGQTHPAKPIGARAYMTGQHAAKSVLYSER